MQPALAAYDVGVIIGRFQVNELHAAQRDLIDHVITQHPKVLVVLGISPLPVSTKNPLDFESRKQMLLDYAPDITVLYVKDQPSDVVWSSKVDELVSDFCSAGQSAVIYGSRDSFIASYRGRFATRELIADKIVSGTVVRREIAKSSARNSSDFRAGVIWASQGRFPTVYTTVDVAILSENKQRMLLGRKQHEKLFRFIGGFANPDSESFEIDAMREVREETTLEVGDLTYIGSAKIPDWRYRGEPDCIKTMLYHAIYTFGRPTPEDDIEEVRWFDLCDADGVQKLHDRDIVPTHRPLLTMLCKHFGIGD